MVDIGPRFKSSDSIIARVRFDRLKQDNWIFQLPKLTSWLILLYLFALVSIPYKHPFQCDSAVRANATKNSIHSTFQTEVNAYCWAKGTFLYTDNPREVHPGGKVPYHLHKYVLPLTIILVLLIFTPRTLWKHFGGYHFGKMTQSLVATRFHASVEASVISKEITKLSSYLAESKGHNGLLAYGFAFCELFNLTVSLGVMASLVYLTDGHLPGAFPFKQAATDNLGQVFPWLTQCNFQWISHGGSVESRIILCLIPINYVNKIAALFFWIYFCIVAAFQLIAVLYRLALILSRKWRTSKLVLLLPHSSVKDVLKFADMLSYPDWFVVSQFGNRVETPLFRDIVTQFIEKM